MIFFTATSEVSEETLAALQQEVQENLEQLRPNVLIDTVKGWMPGLIAFGIKVLIALAVFAVGSRVIKLLYHFLNRSFIRMEMEVSLRKFLLSVLNAAMYCVLVFVVAGQIGVNSASIVALLGSASIAVGLAVQGSLANFAGGVLILMMKPFRVGDYIISKDGEGTVRTIGLVYTVLTTIDNKQVVIPNGTLSNSALTNVTAMDKRKLDIKVGIGYDSDLKQAKKILEEIYLNHPAILKDEPVEVFVDGLEESAVSLGSRGWMRTEDYWKTRWEILEQIKLEFDKAGIQIPYNQLEVHMGNGEKQQIE